MVDELLRRRAKPRVLVLDAELNIAFAEQNAIATIARFVPFELPHRLPSPIDGSIRTALDVLITSGVGDVVLMPVAGLVLRVARLHGAGVSFVSVLVEEEGRRENVQTAAKRYSLTPRESEVLGLTLSGLNANEIAGRMSLSAATVSDYLKSLLKKTSAKNRSDMIAKVLDFSG